MRFRVRLVAAACGACLTASAMAQSGVPEPVQFQPAQSQPGSPSASGPLPPVGMPFNQTVASPAPGVQPPTPNIIAPQLPNSAPPPSATPATQSSTPVAPAAPVAVPQPTPTLTVKQSLPDTINPGQPVVMEVTVTNGGTKPAENVVLAGWWTNGYQLAEASVVAQTVNGRQVWGLGVLAAGETKALKMKLAPQAGVAVSEFRSGFDATCSTATDTRAVKVLKPELQLQLVAAEIAFVGHLVPLQVRIKNPTAVPVSNVVVRSTLGEPLAHPKGNNLESELAVIPAGGTEVLPLDLTAVKAGDGRVRVRVAGANCEPVEAEVRLTAIEARVAVTMNGPKSLYRDWPATYEAVIENQGDQPIRAASFEIKLPPGFTDLRASDKPGYDAASHRIVWKFDALQPGEKKTVVWFGFAKQAEDLTTTGLATVGGAPLKRAEWVTKNLGAESK